MSVSRGEARHAGPPPAVAGEGGRVARAARGMQVTPLWRRACGGTHMCGPALPRRWLSAGRGQGGHSCRASCTGRAGLAAIATRRWRHTHVRPGAGPRPVVARKGGRVGRAARGVQVLPRSRRASGGTHMCGPALALGRPWPGRAVASRELHGVCRSRRDHDAPMAARTCAAWRWPSAGRGRGGRSRRASCTGRAGHAAMATRQWRHAHVRPGAGPRPAVGGEGCRVARAAGHAAIATRRWLHMHVRPFACWHPSRPSGCPDGQHHDDGMILGMKNKKMWTHCDPDSWSHTWKASLYFCLLMRRSMTESFLSSSSSSIIIVSVSESPEK